MHTRDDETRLDVGDVFRLGAGTVYYVVEYARMEGGGTAHGPHDIYPDGWHIKARALKAGNKYDPKGREIEFYQSGCFSHMRTNIKPLGKLKRAVTFTTFTPY
jgi:hypothetical protein